MNAESPFNLRWVLNRFIEIAPADTTKGEGFGKHFHIEFGSRSVKTENSIAVFLDRDKALNFQWWHWGIVSYATHYVRRHNSYLFRSEAVVPLFTFYVWTWTSKASRNRTVTIMKSEMSENAMNMNCYKFSLPAAFSFSHLLSVTHSLSSALPLHIEYFDYLNWRRQKHCNKKKLFHWNRRARIMCWGVIVRW